MVKVGRPIRAYYHLLALAALLTVSGCQTIPKGSFCQIAQPVRLSQSAIANLTDAEVKRLLTHNRQGQKLCGWRP